MTMTVQVEASRKVSLTALEVERAVLAALADARSREDIERAAGDLAGQLTALLAAVLLATRAPDEARRAAEDCGRTLEGLVGTLGERRRSAVRGRSGRVASARRG